MKASERIILALDVDTEKQALDLAEKLAPYVGAFKVGMQLFNSIGPGIVEQINNVGGRVFADLKFHDIPNTVGAAGRVMTRMNVFMFNVHAAGGKEMMQTVVKEVKKEASLLNTPCPLVIAVTVLTSIAQEQLAQELLITEHDLEDVVVKWALMAKATGIDGVVCSPREITAIRSACGADFKIITPGIRPVWSETNDQKRITTPRAALDMGADYMVIGRPITKASDPVAAAKRIIEELEG
jgi:orotidine-5'-phosphate decarboxylase